MLEHIRNDAFASHDPFLSKDIGELAERLLSEGFRAAEPRLVDNPILVNRVRQSTAHVTQLAKSLVVSGRRWISKAARENFKGLMDAALTQPQVVERGDDEIVVISRRLLESYANPKSASSIFNSFSTNEGSVKPFELDDLEPKHRDDIESDRPQ